MNKQLLTIAFVLLACVSFAQSNYHSPYDPSAARNTLSNVTPATGRAALGLGTMAVATSTDYVATNTFTAHTNATGSSVHGLGTISTKADTDYVATSSLAARLDTVNASITSNLNVTKHSTLNTASATLLSSKRITQSETADGDTSGRKSFRADRSVFIPNNGDVLFETVFPEVTLQVGVLEIVDVSGHSYCSIFLRGVASSTLLLSAPSASYFSTASGSNSINIIHDGDGTYTIQNKTGGDTALNLRYVGRF